MAKFCPCIFGRLFKVVTDHHSLCWLPCLKEPCRRLGRWGLILPEYNVAVTNKSRIIHTDADYIYLSHPPQPVTLCTRFPDTRVIVGPIDDVEIVAPGDYMTGHLVLSKAFMCVCSRCPVLVPQTPESLLRPLTT